jgi:polyhydroxyalkanoate synthesis repressor PhaR
MTRRVILCVERPSRPNNFGEVAKAAMPRIIKRYSNRKLYDIAERRYVTLDEIGGLIQANEEVQVVDKPTGKDITDQVLSKVVAATVQQPDDPLPKNALISFIQHPSDALFGYVRRTVSASFDTVQHIDRQFDRLSKMLRDALRPSEPDRAPDADEIAPALRSLIEAYVDQRVQERLAVFDAEHRSELAQLRRRVAALERELNAKSGKAVVAVVASSPQPRKRPRVAIK